MYTLLLPIVCSTSLLTDLDVCFSLIVSRDSLYQNFACFGDYQEYCKKRGQQLPPLWHAIPHESMEDLFIADGDSVGTLYSAAQLRDFGQEAKIVVNTKKGEDPEYSPHVWLNGTFKGMCRHLDNNKGGILSKKKPFVFGAIHPSNPDYFKCVQDMIWHEKSRSHVVPKYRGHFLKSFVPITLDTLWKSEVVGDNDFYTATKAHDPKGLFGDDSAIHNFNPDSFNMSGPVSEDSKPAAKKVIVIED